MKLLRLIPVFLLVLVSCSEDAEPEVEINVFERLQGNT